MREVAKDYKLAIITEDAGNKILADLEGIRAEFRSSKAKSKKHRRPSAPTRPSVQPFRRETSIIQKDSQILKPQMIPGEGDLVTLGSSQLSIRLANRIDGGGEGDVFELNGDNRVAKIYKSDKLTANRIKKLELMASLRETCRGICWPEQLVYAPDGCPVGYVMHRAHGHTLAKSVVRPPLLSEKFPNWNKENLVNLCISLLNHMKYLHSLGVLIGDINEGNILVDGDGSDVFIVDTDSFQVGGFPCPVGRGQFTPRRHQNKDFKSFLRDESDELFAIAIILFMILFTGKHPYSTQGGESPERNIKNGDFPYPIRKDKGKNVPEGPWAHIWSHLPLKMKELFVKAFREEQQVTISQWLDALQSYKFNLSTGKASNDVYPNSFKIKSGEGIWVNCDHKGCSEDFEVHREFVAELNEKGQTPICPKCRRIMKLKRQVAANNRNARRTSSSRQLKTTFPQQGKSHSNHSQKSSGTKILGITHVSNQGPYIVVKSEFLDEINTRCCVWLLRGVIPKILQPSGQLQTKTKKQLTEAQPGWILGSALGIVLSIVLSIVFLVLDLEWWWLFILPILAWVIYLLFYYNASR